MSDSGESNASDPFAQVGEAPSLYQMNESEQDQLSNPIPSETDGLSSNPPRNYVMNESELEQLAGGSQASSSVFKMNESEAEQLRNPIPGHQQQATYTMNDSEVDQLQNPIR